MHFASSRLPQCNKQRIKPYYMSLHGIAGMLRIKLSSHPHISILSVTPHQRCQSFITLSLRHLELSILQSTGLTTRRIPRSTKHALSHLSDCHYLALRHPEHNSPQSISSCHFLVLLAGCAQHFTIDAKLSSPCPVGALRLAFCAGCGHVTDDTAVLH